MRKCYCLHRQVIFLLAAQLSTYAVFVAGFLIITQEPTKRNVFNEINNPQFDRLIVIVVDAMRFDMANPFPDLPLETTPEFVNRVPFIRQLLEQRPHQSAMYKFVADDPTVTTSRLKCMMTGTSPSFLEVGTSFIGITITEDNLLEQYTYRNKSSFVPGQQCDARDKRLWAMGDDTWTQLLSIKDQPSQCSVWNFTDVLPSFTITDVHENDKTILQTLVPQLQKLKKDKSQIDWDLLIGHFLGIDHLMHVKTLKNYQHNPELTVKIDQIDSVLRVVVDFIDREQQEIIQQQIIKQENGQNGSENGDKIRKGTLLVVFGDHGMTEEGTHQGRNLEETDAALFFYSPRPVMAFTQSIIAPNELSQQLNETVAQDNLIDQNNFLYLSRPVCQQEQENDEKRWMKTLKKNELLKNHLIETKYIAQSTHCRPVTAPVQTQYQNGSLDKKSNILVPSNCTSCYPTIRQIDITPTLSALYGIPIPFPSSGKGMAEWTTLLDQEDIVVATQWKQEYIKQQQKNERSNKVSEGYGKDNNESSELSSARSLSSYIGDKSSITEFSRIDQNHYQSKNQFYDERIILNISDDPSLQHDFDLLEYFYREERHPVPPRNRQQIKKIAEKRLPEILIDLEDLKNEQLRNGIFGAIEQSRIERVRQPNNEIKLKYNETIENVFARSYNQQSIDKKIIRTSIVQYNGRTQLAYQGSRINNQIRKYQRREIEWKGKY
ncbi:MAG: putative GPI ethanolamine phosphate transferase 3 [Streblomastix strix]|uniref:Putative GPI ethanolamine phosphate transferase 3 n=1 Tax=Streblomastix strix TaxID=222440 RepID=A0A5J4WQC0_9EUKA|nr:MAG: putative GPI ethanolamine phosphate transferase 3 [Streblomastix strix]